MSAQRPALRRERLFPEIYEGQDDSGQGAGDEEQRQHPLEIARAGRVAAGGEPVAHNPNCCSRR
jgi:hypothetical protein